VHLYFSFGSIRKKFASPMANTYNITNDLIMLGCAEFFHRSSSKYICFLAVSHLCSDTKLIRVSCWIYSSSWLTIKSLHKLKHLYRMQRRMHSHKASGRSMIGITKAKLDASCWIPSSSFKNEAVVPAIIHTKWIARRKLNTSNVRLQTKDNTRLWVSKPYVK